MKNNDRVLILFLLLCLNVRGLSQVLRFNPDSQFSADQTAQFTVITQKLHQFIPHDPIIITNDNNFSSQGFPGLGTIDDPYRIENFNITTSTGASIAIYDTDTYFCIRNNLLNGLFTASSGIEFNYVDHGIIDGNVVTNYFSYGILLEHSKNNILSNNMVFNNRNDGIRLRISTAITISSNTVAHNDDGIFLYGSINNTISNNTLFNNRDGISLWEDSENSIISSNSVSNNNHHGISLRESGNSIISSNSVSNNNHHGIFLWDSENSIISSNSVS
ncbi:MAG: NosD domain-containing protein, partial [Promethearchaeota archaeon]